MRCSTRRRAARLWGVVPLLSIAALALTGGCGGDVPTNYLNGNTGASSATGGSAGSLGAGGSSENVGGDEAGGGGGMPGGAGDSGNGEGGSATGGTIPIGGSAGTGEGGAGGGAEPACGDKTQQKDEECDDGNILDGDGCSSQCMSKCESCEAQHAWNDIDSEADGYHEEAAPEDFSTTCYLPTYFQTPHEGFFDENDIAVGGELASHPRKELWDTVMACVRRTGCMDLAKTPNVVEACYCGTSEDCSAPDGVCKTEFEQAAEAPPASGAQTVSTRFYDIGYALGRAATILKNCDGVFCQDDCF